MIAKMDKVRIYVLNSVVICGGLRFLQDFGFFHHWGIPEYQYTNQQFLHREAMFPRDPAVFRRGFCEFPRDRAVFR